MWASRSKLLAVLALGSGLSALALPAGAQLAWGYREIVMEFPRPPLRPLSYGNTVVESGFRIQPSGGIHLDNEEQYGKHPIVCAAANSWQDYVHDRTVQLGDSICNSCRVQLSYCWEICHPTLSTELGGELNDLFCWTSEHVNCPTGSGREDNGLYRDGPAALAEDQAFVEMPFEVKYKASANDPTWPILDPALFVRFAARSGGGYIHHFDIPNAQPPRDFDQPIAASTPPNFNYTHFRATLKIGETYNVEVRLSVDRSNPGPCSPPTDVVVGETENYVVVVHSVDWIEFFPFQDAPELGW